MVGSLCSHMCGAASGLARRGCRSHSQPCPASGCIGIIRVESGEGRLTWLPVMQLSVGPLVFPELGWMLPR